MHSDTLGCVLAGGRGQRMGGDKALRSLAGRPLLDHVVGRLGPQCAALAINANGVAARFAAWRLPVWPDPLPGQPGPLAGILAALEGSHLPWVVTVPCDTPLLPPDLVARLHAAREAAGLPLACAASAGMLHPPVGLWPAALAPDLRAALQSGEREVARWAAARGVARAEWPTHPLDPFLNTNTPEDLARAETLLAPGG